MTRSTVLTTSQIVKALKNHYINCVVENDHVFALETYTNNGKVFETWEDLTGYTLQDLRDWLGY